MIYIFRILTSLFMPVENDFCGGNVKVVRNYK